MKKEIPTLEEFFEKYSKYGSFSESNPEYLIDKEDFKTSMIEFAKLHVEEALKQALEEVPYGSSTDTVSYEDVKGILTCYPLENIK